MRFPRAKPWEIDAGPIPALKGRHGAAGFTTRQVCQTEPIPISPFQGSLSTGDATQGSALGYPIRPLRGPVPTYLPVNSTRTPPVPAMSMNTARLPAVP